MITVYPLERKTGRLTVIIWQNRKVYMLIRKCKFTTLREKGVPFYRKTAKYNLTLSLAFLLL